MKKPVVFDTWAVISYLKDGRGAKKIGQVLNDVAKGKLSGTINAVNLAEVYYITHRSGGLEYAEQVIDSLSEWGLEVVSADHSLALKAGEIKAVFPISLADAFAAVTALSMNATLLTGDPDFRVLGDQLTIEWL